jgi:hypothetical protein
MATHVMEVPAGWFRVHPLSCAVASKPALTTSFPALGCVHVQLEAQQRPPQIPLAHSLPDPQTPPLGFFEQEPETQ